MAAKAKITALKESEPVLELIWLFYDFYSDFWINRVQCTKRYHLDNKPTHLDYLDYMYYLDCELENVKAYMLLLRIFSELDEEEYVLTVQMIAALEQQIERCRAYLHSQELEGMFDSKSDALNGKTIEKLMKLINTLFKPGYFVDPIKKKLFPNFGQVYDRVQLSRIYNSLESLREKKQLILDKANKAFEMQGKTEIKSLTDYPVYFVN